jgi:hypothetical protein
MTFLAVAVDAGWMVSAPLASCGKIVTPNEAAAVLVRNSRRFGSSRFRILSFMATGWMGV